MGGAGAVPEANRLKLSLTDASCHVDWQSTGGREALLLLHRPQQQSHLEPGLQVGVSRAQSTDAPVRLASEWEPAGRRCDGPDSRLYDYQHVHHQPGLEQVVAF